MRFETEQGPMEARIDTLVIAGWTGRDRAAVRHHVEELAALGVPPPSATPLFYRVGAALLTQAEAIEVLGGETSGEAEPFVLRAGGAIWLGLGSDHTDRGLEAVSVAAAKQACPKPVGRVLWTWEDVAGHLDEIELASEIEEGGAWRPYQSGTLAAIRPLAELMEAASLTDGAAMMCGTLPAIGGIRPAARFRARLRDPVRDREITCEYRVDALPVVS